MAFLNLWLAQCLIIQMHTLDWIVYTMNVYMKQ